MSLEDLLKRVDEAGFTPGPYRVARSDEECTEEWGLDGPGSYAYRPICSEEKLVACVRGDLCDASFEPVPEMDATAHLFAAAPDMFEALKPFALMADWLPEDGRVARIRISDDIDFEITGKDLHRAKEALLRALISQKEGVE